MKAHYFNQDKADADDFMLAMAKAQGYVPAGCLLNGIFVMHEVKNGDSPCRGCNGPRVRCGGVAKGDLLDYAQKTAESRKDKSAEFVLVGWLADDGGSVRSFFRASERAELDEFVASTEPLEVIPLYTRSA